MNKTHSLKHFVYLVGLHIYYKMIHGPHNIKSICKSLKLVAIRLHCDCKYYICSLLTRSHFSCCTTHNLTMNPPIISLNFKLIPRIAKECEGICPLVGGRDSSVGIATRYGPDGPGIESRWGGEIFHTVPEGPPSLLHNGYRVFPGGKAAEAWRWPPTPI